MIHKISDEYINTGSELIKVNNIVFVEKRWYKRRFKKGFWAINIYVNNLLSYPHQVKILYSTEKKASKALNVIKSMMEYQSKRKKK